MQFHLIKYFVDQTSVSQQVSIIQMCTFFSSLIFAFRIWYSWLVSVTSDLDKQSIFCRLLKINLATLGDHWYDKESEALNLLSVDCDFIATLQRLCIEFRSPIH